MTVRVPYKAQLSLDQQTIKVEGPSLLQNRIFEMIDREGRDPMNWQTRVVFDGWDVLINQWIKLVKGQKTSCYPHDELCHCRMIPLDVVENAIKQGVFKQSEISRVTLAGTGCGSCKKDIEEVLQFHIK